MRRPLPILLLALTAAAVWADVDDAPPQLEPLPEVEDQELQPEVTIRRRGKSVIEEYRIGGRLYMVRITPKIGRPYVLYDRDGDGVLETRLPGSQKRIAPPMWILKRF